MELYRNKQKKSLNFPCEFTDRWCFAATEESIHYERKTGCAFARADVLFLEQRNGRMSERASERNAWEYWFRARSRVRPRVCFIIIIAVTRVYLYCVEKEWAGVCNVILHKQDQLIFMHTGERASESASPSVPRRIENNKNRTGQTNGYGEPVR